MLSFSKGSVDSKVHVELFFFDSESTRGFDIVECDALENVFVCVCVCVCRRSTLVTAFCQKTQSLRRRVNRKASSSSGHLPLPSETWALKGNTYKYISNNIHFYYSNISPVIANSNVIK